MTAMSRLRNRITNRAPDFVIGPAQHPYLRRWWVVPRNRLLNIYLHQFLADDDDRALHDHPWANVSVLIEGEYIEVLATKGATSARVRRAPGSVIFRRPSTAHRIELLDGRPCWTLFITGPAVRKWGFWCPQGWRYWRDFVAERNSGEVGKGCAP
jgi:hypothetical protein